MRSFRKSVGAFRWCMLLSASCLATTISFADSPPATIRILEESPGVWGDSTDQFELIHLQFDALNAGALWQDPRDARLFWGRQLRYGGTASEVEGDINTWKSWDLALYRLDEANTKIELVRLVTNGQFTIADGRTITAAYDPAVMIFNNTRYVAFECAGSGFTGSVGVCMGALDADGKLLPLTTKVVVDGISQDPNSNFHQSGSVPKLFLHGNGASLSWTSVKIPKQSLQFQELKTMAASIELDSSGFWKVVGASGAIPADSSLAQAIFTPVILGTADIYATTKIDGGSKYIVTSATGGMGCVEPLQQLQNCYRLDVRIGATAPTGAGSVNAMPAYLTDLPENPVAYVRAIRAADDTLALLGEFLPPNSQNNPDRQVPAGMYLVRHRVLETFSAPAYSTLYQPLALATKVWHNTYAGFHRLVGRLNEELLGQPYQPASAPSAWLAVANQGYDCRAIQNIVLNSAQFRDLAYSLTYDELLKRTYWALLAREPGQPADYNAWRSTYTSSGINALIQGVAGSSEAAAICGSEGSLSSVNQKTWRSLPYAKDRYITRVYEEVLGRTPAPADITAWKSELKNHLNQCAVFSAAVLGSAEFNAIKLNLSPAAQVRRTYWGFLARDVETNAEVVSHEQAIATYGISAWGAALTSSSEATSLCTAEDMALD